VPRKAAIAFDDAAIMTAPYATKTDIVIRDPVVPRLRCEIKRTKKSFVIQMDRPPQFGPRKTHVVVLGEAPIMTIEAARTKALETMRAIADGKDPNASGKLMTLEQAWEKFKARPALRMRTLRGYESLWTRCLSSLATTPLATLSAQPAIAAEWHGELSHKTGPTDANRAAQLLRAVYKYVAKGDRSLLEEQHPCTSIEMNKEERAADDKFIPYDAWENHSKQIKALRKKNQWRASYQMLLLRMGCRPNELTSAKLADIKDDVIAITASKTGAYVVPLCPQIKAELNTMRALMGKLYPKSEYICPPSFATATHPRYTEKKATLAYSGSSGRTTHYSIATALGIDPRVIYLMEGRYLNKNAVLGAGVNYLATHSLGPAAKAAQKKINDRIDKLLAGKM
jgi:integrase